MPKEKALKRFEQAFQEYIEVEDVIELIEIAASPKWLDITEDKPADGQKCIVYIEEEKEIYTKYYYQIKTQDICEGFSHFDDGSFIDCSKGVFWQPYPDMDLLKV